MCYLQAALHLVKCFGVSHLHLTCTCKSWLSTLAAGALAAVDDRQDDGLALSARAQQAEEADRAVRVQAVTAALAQWLEVRLLYGRERGEGDIMEEEEVLREWKLREGGEVGEDSKKGG